MFRVTKSVRGNLALATTITVALISSFFISVPLASADENPIGCFSTGVGVSVAVFRSDGTTPVGGGSATPGETIKYKATLSHPGGSDCNYEAGTLTITTPNGIVTDVTPGAGIPLVSFGVPFVSGFVNYVVSSADAVGDNDLDVSTSYTGGVSHTATSHSSVSGGATAQTPFLKLSPTIATVPSAGGPIGTVLNDTATLSGGSSPTGNVTFKLFPPSDATCSLTPVFTQVDGSAPYATSPGYTSLVAGTYRWTAEYAGDANNATSTSGCQAEQVVIGKFTPSISTVLSTTTTSTSTPVHDTAILSGASADAGGTATYSVFTTSACSAGMMSAGVKNVANGVVPNSDPLVFATPGTYYWQVEYSGDANNESATSPCRSEILVVVAPPPPSTGCEVDWKPVGSGWMDFAPVVFLNKGGRLLDPNNPCPFKYPLDYSPGRVKPTTQAMPATVPQTSGVRSR